MTLSDLLTALILLGAVLAGHIIQYRERKS